MDKVSALRLQVDERYLGRILRDLDKLSGVTRIVLPSLKKLSTEPARRIVPPDLQINDLIRRERGLSAKIAAICNLSTAAVWMWKRVPAKHVNAVSRVLGIPRERIRPDLYLVD